MTAMRWGRRIATGVVLVSLVAIGLGRGVGAQTGPAFSAQIQLALRALLAGDQTITGNWTCSGTCSGFGGGGGGTPAGPVNSVQFNDAGSFGGGTATLTADGALSLSNYEDFPPGELGTSILTVYPVVQQTANRGGNYPIYIGVEWHTNDFTTASVAPSIGYIDFYGGAGTTGRVANDVQMNIESGNITSAATVSAYNANYGATVDTMNVVLGWAADYGGTTTNYNAVESHWEYGGGTITNARGFATSYYGDTLTADNLWGIYLADQVGPGFTISGTNRAIDYAGKFIVDANGNIISTPLKTTGAAGGKKVVCVDTATGQLYASSTGTDCSN